jgi:hypothetical protein
MARLDAGVTPGKRFPGVYQALIGIEQNRFERDEQLGAAMMAEHGRHYRRDRWLAEVLEAGEAVVMRPSTVELALWERDRPPRRVRLPFDGQVQFVEVWPDDSIVPTADPDRDRPVVEAEADAN